MANPRSLNPTPDVLEQLCEFLEGPEEDVRSVPLERVLKDLKKDGADLTPMLKRVREQIDSLVAEEALSRAQEQRQRFLTVVSGTLQRMSSAAADRVAAEFQRLSIESPERAAAYFRKLEKATEADRKSIIEDLLVLEQLEKEDSGESQP